MAPVVGPKDPVNPDDVVKRVLEIAQKEVITMSDYHEVMDLVNANPEKLCLWTRKKYPAGSREYKVADSRLVEIYTYWGKYQKASSLLEKNIMSCTYPSLDHAACMYTQAWMQQQMGDLDKARRIIQAALEEL